MVSEREKDTLDRVRQRVRDIILDYVIDLEDRIRMHDKLGDKLGLLPMLNAELKECTDVLNHSGLGILEILELYMDVIDAKGI